MPILPFFLRSVLSWMLLLGLSPASAQTAGGPVLQGSPDTSGPSLASPADASAPGSADASAEQEAVKLSTRGGFSLETPRAGDSLDYILQVEWNDTQVPVVVLAPDSLEFPGFRVLGQGTVHKKVAGGQGVRNHTEFVYRLRALTVGSGKATAVKLRYRTGLSGREEAVYVPTALVDILPAPKRLFDALWFKLLAGLAFLGAATALGWAAYRVTLRSRAASAPAQEDFRPALKALKSRLKAGDSKDILLEMEGICIRHLRQEPGGRPPSTGAAPARFETLLDTYLASDRGKASPDGQDWGRLRELFRQARFAGGQKEPHELQEAYRILKKCLNITGDDEHE